VVKKKEISEVEDLKRVYKTLLPFIKPIIESHSLPDLALVFEESDDPETTIIKIVNAIKMNEEDSKEKIETLDELYKDNYKGLWILLSTLAPEYLLNCTLPRSL